MDIYPMSQFNPTNVIKQHVIDNQSYNIYEMVSIDKFTLIKLEYADNQIKYGKCKIEGHLCTEDVNIEGRSDIDGMKFDCLGDTNDGWFNIGIENYNNYKVSRYKSVEEFLKQLNNIFNSYKNKFKDNKNNIPKFEMDDLHIKYILDMQKDIIYIKNTIAKIYEKLRNVY